MSERLIVGPSLYKDMVKARDFAIAGRETVKEQALTKTDGLLLLNALNDLEAAAFGAMEIIERNNPKIVRVEEIDG